MDSVDQLIQLRASDVAVAGLRDQWDNGDAGVTTNDGDLLISRVGLLDLGDESGGSDNIESGDTEESLWVVDTLALEDLTADGDCGVDLFSLVSVWFLAAHVLTYRVGDNQNVGVWRSLSDSLGEIPDNAGVCVEQIYVISAVLYTKATKHTVTGHAWLSWHTGWDQDNLSAAQALSKT